MSSTNKTTNYQLSQFVGTDIPSILNDYNGDMRKIDTAIKEVSVAGGDSATAIAELESTVNGHTSEISQQRTAVNGLSGRVIAIEDKIPANASASNKLVTASDIPEVPSIAGLEGRVGAVEDAVEDIEEVIPSNASASNMLVTASDIPSSSSPYKLLGTLDPSNYSTWLEVYNALAILLNRVGIGDYHENILLLKQSGIRYSLETVASDLYRFSYNKFYDYGTPTYEIHEYYISSVDCEGFILKFEGATNVTVTRVVETFAGTPAGDAFEIYGFDNIGE